MGAPDGNLLDIIVSDQSASRSSAELDFSEFVTLEEESEPPAPVKKSFNDVFTRYEKCVSIITGLMGLHHSFEREMFGSTLAEDVRMTDISKIASSAVNQLVYRAQREFAPSGGSLKIETYEVLEATGQGDWERKFHDASWRNREKTEKPITDFLDLNKIWEYLEKTYGGDAGKRLGLTQQANVIIDAFNLNREPEQKRSSSHVSIFKRVYSEKQDYGQDKGRYRLHYNYNQSMSQLFLALVCFAEHAELDALSIAIHPNRHELGSYGYTFDLRSKVNFPGLTIVHYKEKWEFQWSHEAAEKLMLFLGEFGQSSE